MNILFLMLAFPHMETSSGMYIDLVKEFEKRGHDVFPVAPAEKGMKTQVNKEGKIEVLRVCTMELFGVNPVKKGIANLLLSMQFKKAIMKYYRDQNFDLIIVPTPSVLFADVTAYLKVHYKAKVYLILRDIFPQNAIDLGLLSKKNPFYVYFRSKEKKLYRVSDAIGCTSLANVDYILSHNNEIVREQVHILHNFQKKEERRVPDFRLKRKYEIENKFVVVFGGNMGIPQKVENVIVFAKACQDIQNILFLLIGRGTEKEKIKKLINENHLNNVRFIDFVPLNEYKSLLQLCHVGLISLNDKFTVPNTPYKMCDYFDAGLPILASIDANNDLGQILKEANAGLASVAGNVSELKENLMYLYNHSEVCEQMGKNGQKFYDQNMTIENAYDTILAHV